MGSFVDQMYRRNIKPLPPIGIGRVHQSEEDELPSQVERFSAILAAVRLGCASLGALRRNVSYEVTASKMIADCEVLVARRILRSERSREGVRFFLDQGDDSSN